MNPGNLSQADAIPPGISVPGAQLTTGLGSVRQKSLRVNILEWCVVLYALFQSGVYESAYRLFQHGLSSNLRYPEGLPAWIYYFLSYGSVLAVLGYVLFRNSKWCQAGMA